MSHCVKTPPDLAREAWIQHKLHGQPARYCPCCWKDPGPFPCDERLFVSRFLTSYTKHFRWTGIYHTDKSFCRAFKCTGKPCTKEEHHYGRCSCGDLECMYTGEWIGYERDRTAE